MSDLLKYLIDNYPIVVDTAIEGWCQMLGVKRNINPEIVKNFMLKGLEFGDECKITINGKNDESLEVIVSHPLMTDSKSIYSRAIAYSNYTSRKKAKHPEKISFNYLGAHIEFTNHPSDDCQFRLEIYQNLEKYLKLQESKKK
ncbi:MAG: hypothetical protein ACP5N2_04880 [Candidatus Nanoarchaeia archaeon]